jgi:hypothetical protein
MLKKNKKLDIDKEFETSEDNRDVVYNLYKAINEVFCCVQMLREETIHRGERQTRIKNHRFATRHRQQELVDLCIRGNIAEKPISIICKQRSLFLLATWGFDEGHVTILSIQEVLGIYNDILEKTGSSKSRFNLFGSTD